MQNHLIPWEDLENSDELTGWVTDSFLAEGKTELPEGAYRLQPKYTGFVRRCCTCSKRDRE